VVVFGCHGNSPVCCVWIGTAYNYGQTVGLTPYCPQTDCNVLQDLGDIQVVSTAPLSRVNV
jgi:hypothetical protein